MKLLYVDESHDKKFYVLSGLLINDINYRKLNEDFNNFLLNNHAIDTDTELKGDYVWNGRDKWKDLPLDKRVEIIKSIFGFLSKSKGTDFLLSTEPVNNLDKQQIYLALLNKIIGKAAKITSKMGTTNKQLLIIFDERKDFKQDQTVYKQIALKNKEIIQGYKSSCTIIDYGYEGISKFSRMLQIADFAGFFYRSYRSMNEYADLFNKAEDKRKIEFLKSLFEQNFKEKTTVIK